MKITKIDTFFCDAGWRPWIFIKISTDDGIIGWSECTDSHGSPHGLAGVVSDLEKLLLGKDPRQVEYLYWLMHSATRQSPGSIIQKAIGGIENALLDIKCKALGIPVYELLGGPTYTQIPLYWSHCGTTRVRAFEVVGKKQLKTLSDVEKLGKEVVKGGYKALKTNMLILDKEPYVHMPGFNKGKMSFDRNITPEIIDNVCKVMAAFKKGVGKKAGLIIDLNFNFSTEGFIKMAKALEQFDLMWLELDSYDPIALTQIRQSTRTPICSGENLYTLRDFKPYFESHAMDICDIDVIWNGFLQSKKIADTAESYEMGVTVHNYYSHLATFIAAQFCAVIPQPRLLEIDVDDVPWREELTTKIPKIKNGNLEISTDPGWGTEINEKVLAKHPWPK